MTGTNLIGDAAGVKALRGERFRSTQGRRTSFVEDGQSTESFVMSDTYEIRSEPISRGYCIRLPRGSCSSCEPRGKSHLQTLPARTFSYKMWGETATVQRTGGTKLGRTSCETGILLTQLPLRRLRSALRTASHNRLVSRRFLKPTALMAQAAMHRCALPI